MLTSGAYQNEQIISSTYKMYFNSSYNFNLINEILTYHRSDLCSKYYANSFLENFVKLEPWLNSLCITDLSIVVDPVAWVRAITEQVSLVSQLEINFKNKDLFMNSINQCSLTISEHLQNVTKLDTEIAEFFKINLINFSIIEANSDCISIFMEPKKMFLYKSYWFCPSDYILVYRENYSPVCFKEDHHTISFTKAANIIESRDIFDLQYFNYSNMNYSTIEKTSKIKKSDLWFIEAVKSFKQLHIKEGERIYEINFKIFLNNTMHCTVNYCPGLIIDIKFIPIGIYKPKCRRTNEYIPHLLLGPILLDGKPIYHHTCKIKLPQLSLQTHPSKKNFNITLKFKSLINHKYDPIHSYNLSLTIRNKESQFDDDSHLLEVTNVPILIENKDKKSTCQSINDPHITTFDGLQMNIFLEGEFVLYRHKKLPFSVNAIFQKCDSSILASCNCGVAVQSANDVLIIERCIKKRKYNFPDVVYSNESNSIPFRVQMFLNGNLTKGTEVYQEADGKKYYIFLPHGAFVKIIVNKELFNIWIIPSPNDLYHTEGLCGFYDWNPNNDLKMKDGSLFNLTNNDRTDKSMRIHPTKYLEHWRVDINSVDSLFKGYLKHSSQYSTKEYCYCTDTAECQLTRDVNFCEIYKGKDITDWLIEHAIPVNSYNLLKKRSIIYHEANNFLKEPILINKKFLPPKYHWKDNWNEVLAKSTCEQYIQSNYSLGILCSQIKSVQFNNEITSCIEDVKITGSTSWVVSAQQAMKEECLSEAQRDPAIAKQIVDKINDQFCINDCSGYGVCTNGSCVCRTKYKSVDCSIYEYSLPKLTQIAKYGLCDIRYMNCSSLFVYGENFIDNTNLSCHLEDCKINEKSYSALGKFRKVKAIFNDFNAVVCQLPKINCFLIRISNNGINTSKPMLFIPFDSACSSCNVINTTCFKKPNSCIIDGICYLQGQISPVDNCMICKTIDGELQWITLNGINCTKEDDKTDIVIVTISALTGSIIGGLIGFLIYKFYCLKYEKKKKFYTEDDSDLSGNSLTNNFTFSHPLSNLAAYQSPFTSLYTDRLLHRNRRSFILNSTNEEIDSSVFTNSDFSPRTNFSNNNLINVSNDNDINYIDINNLDELKITPSTYF